MGFGLNGLTGSGSAGDLLMTTQAMCGNKRVEILKRTPPVAPGSTVYSAWPRPRILELLLLHSSF